MSYYIQNDKGGALLISLMLVLMLAILGITAVHNSNTDMELSYNQQNSERALYIAEAGAKRAFAKIMNNSDWDSGFVDIAYNGGDYTVQVIDSTTDSTLADSILIVSVANYKEGYSSVEITLASDLIHPFKYAMFAKNSVDIRNSFNTDSYNSDSGSYWATQENLNGDVGSNGDIIIKNGAVVGGDASTSDDGGLSINPGATIYGDTTSSAPEQDVPSIAQDDFDSAEASNAASTGISGSYTYDAGTGSFVSKNAVTFTTGTYYFTSFILKNTASVVIPAGDKVTIYVDGDIEIKNSGTINSGGDPSNLMFYSSGDMVLKNSASMYATLYNPDGDADLRNSGDFYGSIVANDIICHNSAKFHYDRNLGNITEEGDGNLGIVAWKEN